MKWVPGSGKWLSTRYELWGASNAFVLVFKCVAFNANIQCIQTLNERIKRAKRQNQTLIYSNVLLTECLQNVVRVRSETIGIATIRCESRWDHFRALESGLFAKRRTLAGNHLIVRHFLKTNPNSKAMNVWVSAQSDQCSLDRTAAQLCSQFSQ